MIEHTLAIIKPDAVSRGLIGKILARIEEQGFRVRALRMVQLSKQTAQAFYQVHAERPFYESLTTYMSSGPVVPMLLERENAIQSLRELMGATNPEQAAAGQSVATTEKISSATPSMAQMLRRRPPWRWPSFLAISSGFDLHTPPP